MDEIKKKLSKLGDIISDYDCLLDRACGYGIYDDNEYEKMDTMRNRGYEIINEIIKTTNGLNK